MSMSRDLCLGAVDRIVDHLGLTEVAGATSPEYLVLTSPMIPDGSVGVMRVFRRPGIADLIYVSMTVPMIGLDSHMLFAFTPLGSAVPHFTLDSVAGGGGPGTGLDTAEYAFHLDLIPKLDLGAHLAYMDHCFGPLTELLAEAKEIEGLSAAHLTPRQFAIMSAWMLVNRATEAAFRAVMPTVDAYLDHWFTLVDDGVPDEVLDGATSEEMTTRDERNRAIIFNPDVDPVWARVAQLVGDDQAEVVRSTLATPMAAGTP